LNKQRNLLDSVNPHTIFENDSAAEGGSVMQSMNQPRKFTNIGMDESAQSLADSQHNNQEDNIVFLYDSEKTEKLREKRKAATSFAYHPKVLPSEP